MLLLFWVGSEPEVPGPVGWPLALLLVAGLEDMACLLRCNAAGEEQSDFPDVVALWSLINLIPQ